MPSYNPAQQACWAAASRGGGERHVAVEKDRGPEHHAFGAVDKAGNADSDGRKLGAVHARLGANAAQQGFHRVDQFRNLHRAGAAGDHVIRDQVAGKIHDHGGMFAV